jgi:hypothetical protein
MNESGTLARFSLENESEMSLWDSFVTSHPTGTPFHLSSWIRVIHETYSFEPRLYASLDADGRVSGVFPFFIVKGLLFGTKIISSPFSDYGGPLSRNSGAEEKVLFEALGANGWRPSYIEIRGPVENPAKFVCHNYYMRHVIDLAPGLEEVRKRVEKRTILRSIRNAEKAGVTIREDNSLEGIKEFSRLNFHTRKKHGVPAQPARFFRKLYEHIVSHGLASVLLAEYDSKIVAASFFLKSCNMVVYKYNASDKSFLSKVTPNHLLTWFAIQQACEQGYQFFDFGRTSPDNEGLIRYKRMWGAEEKDLPYFYYPSIKGLTSTEESGFSYRLFTSMWRRLPDMVARTIGPMIFRYFG